MGGKQQSGARHVALALLPLAVLALGLQVQALAGVPGLQRLLTGHQQPQQQQSPVFQLRGQPSPHIESMLAWLRQQGGTVNVAVREVPGQGRVTLAPQHISPGDILAVIPRQSCFVAAADEWQSAAKLWLEMQEGGRSPLAPYMQGLPLRTQVASYYDLPTAYAPLIQNTAMAGAIQQVQQQLRAVAEAVKQQSHGAAAAISPADMRYTISLLKTRSFATSLGELMLPVVDLANHHNGCQHSITTYADCRSLTSGESLPGGCVVWRAEVPVPAGKEVCNSYHDFMLQDRALLQYGMLQEGAPAQLMSGIDRADFDPQQPFLFQEGRELTPFSGTTQEVEAEAARLSQLLADMRALDATHSTQPDAEMDQDGSLLAKLLAWRAQRQAAIAAELQRLQSLMAGAASAA